MAFLGANVERYFIEVLNANEQFHLVRMEGVEGISQLFNFRVELVCDNAELPIDELLGNAAVITLLDRDLDGSDQTRFIHGIVNQIEVGQRGVEQTTYYVQVVPKIWPITLRQNSRIFQNLSVQDIVTEILKDAGLKSDEYRFSLSATLPPRVYCVQYQESDMQFISRLLEDEGIHYYFEHVREQHVLVMSDTSQANPKIIPEDQLSYFYDSQGQVRDQHVYDFRYVESVKSGKVSLRDYNFKKPRLKLAEQKIAESSTASSAEVTADLEIYHYPGLFKDPAVGKNYAKLHLEALNHDRQYARANSDVTTLLPGYSFTLEGHDRDVLNTEYLITQVAHKCAQTQVLEVGATEEGTKYENTFHSIPFTTPYRPLRHTPRPLIQGSQTATVTGPSGEEIYTDEFGRVKVQFHWDREGVADEVSSCWIRVSQPAAGAGFGGLFLPRIGEEVIVDFLEGDPDKPLIIGRVYHGLNRPPYKLPEQKTKSTLKTNSTKGGKGFNEWRFEDKKGEEQVFVHGEKDRDMRIKNDARGWVGRDRHQTTVNDSTEEIQGDFYAKTIGDAVGEVQGNSDRRYESDLTQETQGNEHYHIASQHIVEINGDKHLKIANNQNVQLGSKQSTDVGNEIHIKAGDSVILDAGNSITLKAGGSFITIGPSGVNISGSAVNIVASGTAVLQGGALNLNSGGSAGSAASAAPTAPAMPRLPAEPEAPEGPRKIPLSPPAQVWKTKAPFCRQCEMLKKKREAAAAE